MLDKIKKNLSWLWTIKSKEIQETTKSLVNSETTQQGLKISAQWFKRITNIILLVFIAIALIQVGWAYFQGTNADLHVLSILVCLTFVILSFDNGKTLFRMKHKNKQSRFFGAFVVTVSVLWGIFVVGSYFDLSGVHKSLTDKMVFTINFSALFVMLGLLQFSIHEQTTLSSNWPKLLYYPVSASRTTIIAYGIWMWERYNLGSYIALITLLVVIEFALYMVLFRRYREIAEEAAEKNSEDSEKNKEAQNS